MKFEIKSRILLYCDRATIGVLKYISRRTQTRLERCFWILCILVSLISSVFLINEAIEKFREQKIVIKLSEKRRNISEIPFPALSICPEVLITEDDLNELVKLNLSFRKYEKLRKFY